MSRLLTSLGLLFLGMAILSPARLLAQETSGETKKVRSLPKRIMAPKFSPRRAGRRAIKQYDANKDGKIDREELAESPALKSALTRIDRNADGAVAADEIADRIQEWLDSKLGRMTFCCSVTLDGKPLGEAVVRFVPEEFLGKTLQVATGATDENGTANVSIPDADPPGVAPGLYRVEISKTNGGKETIPAHYNTKTVFGLEIAVDADCGGDIVFALESAKGVKASGPRKK